MNRHIIWRTFAKLNGAVRGAGEGLAERSTPRLCRSAHPDAIDNIAGQRTNNVANVCHLTWQPTYKGLLHDSFAQHAFINTVIILVIAIVVIVPAGFFLALLLNSRVAAGGVLRALLFAPQIIAPILVGLIWIFILDPKIGLINRLLAAVGLSAQPLWIGGATLSPFAIALVYCWSSVGFAMTIFFAGLQTLPADVMEASALDGATSWKQIRYVTIPLMKPTFLIIAVLIFTGALRIFELVYQLTGGGPVHASEVLVSYMYYVTFTLQSYGPGMALAIVITLLGAVVAGGYALLTREKTP